MGKVPFNRLENEKLHRVLRKFTSQHYQGLIYLHLTVTGFGSTFVEYEIPDYNSLPNFLRRCFDHNLLFPEAISIRFDPFLELGVDDGIILSNMQASIFEDIVEKFSAIGVADFISSRMDPMNYAAVADRLEALALNIFYPSNEDCERFASQLDDICRRKNFNFKLCCDPPIAEFTQRRGCIDGNIFDRIKKSRFPQYQDKCDLRLHNDVTKGQRPDCHCTYSQDIGYSKGITRCYSHGNGCIYCYSQHGMNRSLKSQIMKEIERLKEDFRDGKELTDCYERLMVNNRHSQRTQ